MNLSDAVPECFSPRIESCARLMAARGTQSATVTMKARVAFSTALGVPLPPLRFTARLPFNRSSATRHWTHHRRVRHQAPISLPSILARPILQPRVRLGTSETVLALMVALLNYAQKDVLKVLGCAPKLAERNAAPR